MITATEFYISRASLDCFQPFRLIRTYRRVDRAAARLLRLKAR
jgi:hypothetical protein